MRNYHIVTVVSAHHPASTFLNNKSLMIIIKRIAAGLGILVLSLGLAHDANAQPLTPKQVKLFIASMPETTALGEKHNDNKRRNIDPAKPLTSSLKLMDPQSPAYLDLVQLALRHGFSSVEQ